MSKCSSMAFRFDLSVGALTGIVGGSRRGRVTIPKGLRVKYGIENKVLIEEAEGGILLKRVPSPYEDLGSFKSFLKGKNSRQLLREARKESV